MGLAALCVTHFLTLMSECTARDRDPNQFIPDLPVSIDMDKDTHSINHLPLALLELDATEFAQIRSISKRLPFLESSWVGITEHEVP